MQITFDTFNPKDLAILHKLLVEFTALSALAQPEVAQNTGTVASVVSAPSAEGDGVSVGEAVAPTASPAPEKKRARKAKVELQNDSAESAERFVDSDVVEEAPELPLIVETMAPQSVAEPTLAPAPGKAELTLDDVRAALQLLTSKKGIPAGIEALREFGAGRISELTPENYAAFIRRCEP